MSAPNLSTIFLAKIGPIPLTIPLPKYLSIPSVVVGGTVRRTAAFSCSPVFLVPGPRALSGQPFSGTNRRRGTDHSYQVAMAGGFHS
jgi:hypothetical protein